MIMGMNWIGIEIEEKFVELGKQNIELWQRLLGNLPNLGSAQIFQGDSRRLGEIIRILSSYSNKNKIDIIISSPPYTPAQSGGGIMKKGYTSRPDLGPDWVGNRAYAKENIGNTLGNLANLPEGKFDLICSSPPFCNVLQSGKAKSGVLAKDSQNKYPNIGLARDKYKNADYGQSLGQLGSMKEGKFDLICSSPPYAVDVMRERGKAAEDFVKKMNLGESSVGMQHDYGQSPGQLGSMKEGLMDMVISSSPYSEGIDHGHAGKNADKESYPERYGTQEKYASAFESKGNLGTLKEDSFDLCVSSPPYGNPRPTTLEYDDKYDLRHPPDRKWGRESFRGRYTEDIQNEAQLGNLSALDDTFWTASFSIVQQCYDLLKSGGHAIWITKRYVKNKQIVEFSQKWASLCESVGFEVVCWHKAMLRKEFNTQLSFDGTVKQKVIERKSFFRRLAESKGSPRIDWEDVICMRKQD